MCVQSCNYAAYFVATRSVGYQVMSLFQLKLIIFHWKVEVYLSCIFGVALPDRTASKLPISSKDREGGRHREETNKVLNGNSGDPSDKVNIRTFFHSHTR